MPSKIRGGTKDKHLADMHIPRVSALGAGGGAAGPTTLILDQFTDADTTALTSHTIAPTNTPATSWTANLGTWTISSNQAMQALTAAKNYVATCDAGVANVTTTCTVNTSATNVGAGLAVRLSDSNNFWFVELESTTDVLRLREIAAGVTTTRASTALTVDSSTTYAVQFVASGTSLTGSVGATSVNYSSALFQTNTKHGIHEYRDVPGSYGANSFDDFQVTTP